MIRAGQPATTMLAGTSSMTTAPAATTAFSPMCTPSMTTAFAPMRTLSSTMTGVAEAGSMTPASTAPAPTWQCFPTVARPPRTAPMSIIVPSPTTAPMLMIAPIMMTAFGSMVTCSRMIAPGSMRAGISFMSSSGTALLRRSCSTTRSSILSAFASRMGLSSAQSPKTILSPAPKTLAAPKSTGAFSFT